MCPSCSFCSDMLPYESKSYFMRLMMLQSRNLLYSLILGRWTDYSRAAWTGLMMLLLM